MPKRNFLRINDEPAPETKNGFRSARLSKIPDFPEIPHKKLHELRIRLEHIREIAKCRRGIFIEDIDVRSTKRVEIFLNLIRNNGH